MKNSQSLRVIPLHPEVIRLGFIPYVEAIRGLSYDLVFPDLRSPTSSAPLGDRLYDEFIVGLKQAIPNASDRRKTIHSFRKTFGDSLKQRGVSAEVRADILGHGGETVTEEVYCDAIALSAMLGIIMRLPNVTGHLEKRLTTLLPWIEQKAPAPFSRRRRQSD